MKLFFIILLIIFTASACFDNAPSEPKKETKQEENIQNENNQRKVLNFVREETLGEAVTELLDNGKNRVTNISVCCNAINGVEIFPGGEFSFNDTVGERSTEKGYLEAPVMINGEKSNGIGGGICQVSSTIYMAAVNANLQIKERHLHSEEVPYAPGGTDATVVFGELDLKFINNTADTIYLYTWIQDNKVYSKIIKKKVVSEE